MIIVSQDGKHSVGKNESYRFSISKQGKEIIAEEYGKEILLGSYGTTERTNTIFRKLCLSCKIATSPSSSIFYMPRY